MASHRNTLFCRVLPQCSTQFPWSDLLLPKVCSDMHVAFSGLPGVCTARFPVCIDDPIAGELVPAAPLDARTSCCISVSSISRRLPVAFVTGVDVSFDSKLQSPQPRHVVNMCAAWLPFGFLWAPSHCSARVVFSRHLSVEPHRFDSWRDLCVENVPSERIRSTWQHCHSREN